MGLDDERDIKGNDMPSASQILRQLCCIPSNHPEDNSLDEMARPTSVNPLQQQGSSVARTPSCSTDNVHNVSPEEKKLFADTFSFRHPEYGSVDIHRDNKKDSDRIITLTIKMDDEKQKKGWSKEMYISNEDPEHHGDSTVGYSDIVLPENMQNKGISHLLHYAATDAASRLGVKKFVIDNVVSVAMHSVCARLEMKEDGLSFGSYSGNPDSIKDKCSENMRRKGWIRNIST
ncbi:hypothetical protein AAGR22_21460 [Erwinia sp. HDF1-3R]|uniref:hypothetical protein n=1 Tax=Erwinia sp. HDF1-3R TaxID=3141543 RepID=UPI0031F4D1B4